MNTKRLSLIKEIIPIVEITNATQFDRLGLEVMYERSYIAVDPALMGSFAIQTRARINYNITIKCCYR